MFCWLCNCAKGGALSFHNFSRTAPHRRTAIDHLQYLCACAQAGADVSKLFDVPGFILELIAVDLMHTFDLGVLLDILGSLFFTEITCKRSSSSSEPSSQRKHRRDPLQQVAPVKRRGRGLVESAARRILWCQPRLEHHHRLNCRRIVIVVDISRIRWCQPGLEQTPPHKVDDTGEGPRLPHLEKQGSSSSACAPVRSTPRAPARRGCSARRLQLPCAPSPCWVRSRVPC